MLRVNLDFANGSLLGRYSVEYEPDASDWRTVTKEEIDKLRVAAEKYNSLAKKIERDGFPDLSPLNYKTYEDFPLWQLAEQRELGVRNVPCDEILGVGWANTPRHLMSGNYPKPRKVRELLAAYLNLNEDGKDTAVEIEPIEIYRVMGICLTDDGNHRLYVSRLLGRPTIRAVVWEVDYEDFLKRSLPFKRGTWLQIGHKKEGTDFYTLYEVSEKAYQRYLQLKKAEDS